MLNRDYEAEDVLDPTAKVVYVDYLSSKKEKIYFYLKDNFSEEDVKDLMSSWLRPKGTTLEVLDKLQNFGIAALVSLEEALETPLEDLPLLINKYPIFSFHTMVVNWRFRVRK